MSTEFQLDILDFESNGNRIGINVDSIYGDSTSWLLSLGDLVGSNPYQVYMQITEVDNPNIFGIYSVYDRNNSGIYWTYDLSLILASGTPTNKAVYSISWVKMGNGSSGTSGASGSSGSSGSDGSSGSSGSSGSDGSSGTSGSSGSDGSSGSSGSSGINGSTVMNNPAITTSSLLSIPSGLETDYFSVDTSASGSGAAISITLPEAIGVISNSKIIHIKDEGGSAGTNNITIIAHTAEKIDGESSYVINTDYGSITLIKNSSGPWFIISKV